MYLKHPSTVQNNGTVTHIIVYTYESQCHFSAQYLDSIVKLLKTCAFLLKQEELVTNLHCPAVNKLDVGP